MATRQRLSRQDWVDAAVVAMAKGGLGGIAVEPLAKKLGATKGSFYWHFRDRGELVTAALESWERGSTDAIIETLRPHSDGRVRLRQLMEALFLGWELTDTTASAKKEVSNRNVDTSIALDTEQDNPLVAEVIGRMTARRVAYVAGELTALGVPEQEAQRRSLLAYTAYLGHAALSRSAPQVIPHGSDGEKFVDSVLNMLLM